MPTLRESSTRFTRASDTVSPEETAPLWLSLRVATLATIAIVVLGVPVALLLAWRGLAAGAVLAFARALGDFGATLMVAGDIPGLTQTASLAIYDAVQIPDAAHAARALRLTLCVSAISIASLLIVQWTLP